MVWNYQNADCSLRKNLLCHLLYFSAHFRSLWLQPRIHSVKLTEMHDAVSSFSYNFSISVSVTVIFIKSVQYLKHKQVRSLFSCLRMLTTWHCPHLLLCAVLQPMLLLWRMASQCQTDGYLPSRLLTGTEFTAWWQRQVRVNNLPKVVTWKWNSRGSPAP